MLSLTNFIFDDNTILNSLVNATALTSAYFRATGKRKDTRDWLVTKEAAESTAYLERATGIPQAQLVIVENGVGTWMHPDLAEIFAQWISVEYRFAVVQLIRTAKDKSTYHMQQVPTNKLLEVDQSKLMALTTQAVGVLAQAAQLSSVVEAQLCYKAILSIAPELEQHLTAVQQLIGGSLAVIEQPFYLPGELGSQVSKSAIAINKMLIIAGLQVKNLNKRSKTEPDYQATNLGEPHSDYLLITGHAKDNSTYQQLKWKASVLAVIMPNAAAIAS